MVPKIGILAVDSCLTMGLQWTDADPECKLFQGVTALLLSHCYDGCGTSDVAHLKRFEAAD